MSTEANRILVKRGAELLVKSICERLGAWYADDAFARGHELAIANKKEKEAYEMLKIGSYKEIQDAFRNASSKHRGDSQLYSGMNIDWNRLEEKHKIENKWNNSVWETCLKVFKKAKSMDSAIEESIYEKRKQIEKEYDATYPRYPYRDKGIKGMIKVIFGKRAFLAKVSEFENKRDVCLKRIESLERRRSFLKNFDGDIPNIDKNKKIHSLAVKRLTKSAPDLAKKYKSVKDTERKEKLESLKDKMKERDVNNKSHDNCR